MDHQSAAAQPLIILVRPQLGENIGAAARAMLNFGLRGMRLVAPRDGWPNARAGATASGAGEVLDNARLFPDVDAAVADCQFVLATTVRQRQLHVPVYDPIEACAELRSRIAAGQRTAVLFGAEKTGLETDEVVRADAILTIPVNPDFSSLNLAQAVCVLAYEWARAGSLPRLVSTPFDPDAAPRGALEGMLGHLFEVLDMTGYFFPEEKRTTMEEHLRTLFLRAALSEAELRLFRGVLRQIQWKLRQGAPTGPA